MGGKKLAWVNCGWVNSCVCGQSCVGFLLRSGVGTARHDTTRRGGGHGRSGRRRGMRSQVGMQPGGGAAVGRWGVQVQARRRSCARNSAPLFCAVLH